MHGDRLYTSESDVYGRQILTYKDGPRAERVKIALKRGLYICGPSSTRVINENSLSHVTYDQNSEVGVSSPNSDCFFCDFLCVLLFLLYMFKKMDRGVGGRGLADPSFSRIFGFVLS